MTATKRTFPFPMLALALCLTAIPSAGQAGEAQAPVAVEGAQLPGPVEIAIGQRALGDSSSLAMRTIAGFEDIGALAAEVAAAGERREELEQFLATVAEAEYLRPERIMRLRDQAIQRDQQLEAIWDRAISRLDELGRIRADWLQRRRDWTDWRQALRNDPEYALMEPEIEEALARIEEVLERVGNILRDIIPLQREIESLRRENDRLLETVNALRLGRRAALLRQDQPVLLSAAFRDQFREEPWEEWRPLAWAQTAPYLPFLRENAGVLLTHLLLGLALSLGARRLRRSAAREDVGFGVLAHPWAFGIFSSTVVVVQRYTFSPPLWDVVTWSLVAGSAAVLSTRLIAPRPLRLMVYFFAAFYPLFLLGEAVRLPEPLFRSALASGSALGLLLFTILARRITRGAPEGTRVAAVLGFGSLLVTVIFLAELLGFYQLARWVVHATVTSALLFFTVGLLLVVARGGTEALLRLEGDHLRFIRRVGATLAERLLVLVQIGLVVAGVLVLLDVWELAPSPIDTWRRISAVGFPIGTLEITLGRILLAVVIVYLSVLVSWMIRTFVESEVTQRWNVERGVGDSINRLLHYTILTIGVLLGLGAVGVHLQNFAIVAGALGIGIGFGLQNVVNNFVSGLILLFERPVRVGDTVVIGGEWGTIRKIGLRSTIIMTFDQSELIVPNGDLVAEKVTNWTLSNPVARLVVPVGVAYGTDVQQVLRILEESGRCHPAVLDEPPPQAIFIGFGDSSLDFELRVWVLELRLRLEVQSRVLTEIDTRFREASIEIPFPQRDLHVRSVDPRLLAALREGRSSKRLREGEARP